MFSGYFDNSRTNIEEANKHLTAMMTRIGELETTVKEQASALYRKDEETRMQFSALEESKNREISRLRNEMHHVESDNLKLKDMCHEKDLQIDKLHKSYVILNDIVKSRSMIEKLANQLVQAEHVDDPNKVESPFPSADIEKITNGNSSSDGGLNNTPTKSLPVRQVKHNKPMKPMKQQLASNLLLNTSYAFSADEDIDISPSNSIAESNILYTSSGGKEHYF